MAAAGHPVSELYPLGGAVSLETTLSGQSLFDTSRSSLEAVPPSRLAGGPGLTCQEEPKGAFTGICSELTTTPPTEDTNRIILGIGEKPSEQKQIPSEQCVATWTSSRPQSLAETQTPSQRNEPVVNEVSDNSAGRTIQGIKPASLPVHRSHSGSLTLVQQGVPPQAPDSETYHGGSIQEAERHSVLACKQPMQLQQCNIITTIYRGASSGEGSVQQPLIRCACVSSPKATAKTEGVEIKDSLPPKFDKAPCCPSYIQHANFEDTFAAYCHPQPIPAPSQVLRHPVESGCDIQHTTAPFLLTNQLTLPRLISSVSETGLDAKHLLRCCNLSCSFISTLPPGAGPQPQKQFGLEQCCNSPVGHVRTMTRDMGTMTAHKELRDVGVQAGQIVTPHVFPQIYLAEKNRSEISCSQTPHTDGDGGKKQGSAPKSPVKEVKWDAEGMTWEVYGASVDPEELGLAIQKHLELQIKETASHAAKMCHENANMSQQSRRKRSKMIGSIRTPVCCACTTTAVD